MKLFRTRPEPAANESATTESSPTDFTDLYEGDETAQADAATGPLRAMPETAPAADGMAGDASDLPVVPGELGENAQAGVSGDNGRARDGLQCSAGQRCGPVRWQISDESNRRLSCDGHLLENVLWFERATIEAVGTESGRALARAARAVLAGEGLK
jgi:hypothetical protein